MLSDLPLYLQPWNFIDLFTDIGWSLHVISKHVESSYLLFIDMEPHIFFSAVLFVTGNSWLSLLQIFVLICGSCVICYCFFSVQDKVLLWV